jgi:hypothetical protein
MKTCPECAEQIQGSARVCRFCGHRFSEHELASSEAKERADDTRKMIGRALPIALVLLFVWFCSTQRVDAPTTETPVAAVDPKPCNDLIDQATKKGLVRERPAPNRIDVEDRLWSEFPADSKRGLAMAVRCSAANGTPGQLDYGVVYGYRSGKRLAMATSVGVNFE